MRLRPLLLAAALLVCAAPALADRPVTGPSSGGGGASDATSSTNGIVRLSGELSGTAAAPTVNPCGSGSNVCARVAVGSDLGIQIQAAWNSLVYPGGAARA